MGFFGGFKPCPDEEVSAEHDGAAFVEVETVGQHRVVAKRQKTMVQSLRNFVKCSAVLKIGGDTIATANRMGAKYRKE